MVKRWILRWLGIEEIIDRLAVLERSKAPEEKERLAVPADVIGEWLE